MGVSFRTSNCGFAGRSGARQKLVDRGLDVYSVESRGGRLAGWFAKKAGVDWRFGILIRTSNSTPSQSGLPIWKALDLLATRAVPRPQTYARVISQIRDASGRKVLSEGD